MSLHVSRMVPLAMALLLLGGCNRQPKDVLGTPMTTEAAATATPEQSSTPDGLEDAGLSVLGYDEIRAIARDSAPGFDQMDGYYTMSQDGLWGLMRSDGTEVLPCQFSVPLTGCASAGLAWHALNDPSLTVERLDELNAQLQAGGDGTMCSGEHGGSSRYWYYDTDTQQVRVYGGMEVASVQDLSETDTAYGNYLPCMLGTYVDGQGDPDYYEATDPVTVVYANADGTPLNDQSYQAGNCFYDQALTAAEQNGKWLYLDQNGAAVTEAVYDATYGTADTSYASPLLNGYAPVCRDGQWGLLDAAGTEVVPCAYQGAAWDGGLLWLRQEDGWHAYTLPGVVKPTPAPTPDPLAELPDTITAPDRLPGDQDQTVYTTTQDGNLMLRAGPGTDYDQVGTIPPGSEISCLGLSDAAPDWILTRYEDTYGWASTEYMN